MTALLVIGCVLLALVLIGRIRVGAAVLWAREERNVIVRVGPFRIRVLPAPEKKKEKPPKKEKKKKPREGEPGQGKEKPKRDVKALASLITRLVPVALDAAGRMLRKIRFDRLNLSVVWGSPDPARTAELYGASHAAMGAFWPLLERAFRIKAYRVHLGLDYGLASPDVTADVQVTMTVGQGVSLAFRTGFRALKLFLGYLREQKKKQAGKTARPEAIQKHQKAVQA